MTSNIPEPPPSKAESEMTTILTPNPEGTATSTSQQLLLGITQQITAVWGNLQKSAQATPTIVAIILGVPVLLVLSSVLSFLNSLPLIPDLLELVGLIYLLWFAYRYLLFAESRQELVKTIDGIKKKVLG